MVPFLKVDKGLPDEVDGVQLMKPIPGLDALVGEGRESGVFGTKVRSVIKLAMRGHECGRRAAVRDRPADPRSRPCADHRARGRHPLPAKSRSGGSAQGGILEGVNAAVHQR